MNSTLEIFQEARNHYCVITVWREMDGSYNLRLEADNQIKKLNVKYYHHLDMFMREAGVPMGEFNNGLYNLDDNTKIIYKLSPK